VRAWERGVLHGITLYARRSTSYSHIDPEACREMFIREGLVEGELDDAHAKTMPFFQHNCKLMAEIERLEHKIRRPDVLVDAALIHAFYDAQIPREVTDVRAFEAWRKQAEQKQPRLLYLEREQLMRHEAAGVTSDNFPSSLMVLGQKLNLSYVHQPGEADDGVTLTVPLAMLNQVPVNRCEWLVPGLLEEKVVALLKSVPPKHRHRLLPIGDSAAAFMEHIASNKLSIDEPLLKALQRFVEDRVQLKLPLESFRTENLNSHCLMNFRVVDPHGRVLGQSRNLSELRVRFKDQVAAAFGAAQMASPMSEGLSKAAPAKNTDASASSASAKAGNRKESSAGTTELPGFTSWSFGELPELLEVKIAGKTMLGFPALHDDGNSVSLRAFDTEEEAARVHRKGLGRLFALKLAAQVKAIEKLPGLRDLTLQFMPYGSEAELKAQLVTATLDRTCLLDPLPTDAATFAQRVRDSKPRITLVAQELMRLVALTIAEHAALNKKLLGIKGFPEALADMQTHVAKLMPKNFLVAISYERLVHCARYLKAGSVRIDKLRTNPARDAQLMAEVKSLQQAFEREWLAKAKASVVDPQLEEFRWLLEELRVSLFAQELKTPVPVSVKRLQKIWDSRPR
ncbi:MAG TPA: DUF3418 domain-containing protein, partial [Rhodocyclaceae bacterium]|nr:DUF3418 domain-containing protein [Rhodocyclaceae bacterium]